MLGMWINTINLFVMDFISMVVLTGKLFHKFFV